MDDEAIEAIIQLGAREARAELLTEFEWACGQGEDAGEGCAHNTKGSVEAEH